MVVVRSAVRVLRVDGRETARAERGDAIALGATRGVSLESVLKAQADLARVKVVLSQYGAKNPNARYKKTYTLEEVANSLNRGETGLIDVLGPQFEKALITRALAHTGGRRIEAAQLLGLGRNTLTRKIQELGLDAGKGGDA